jgi:predicted N-acetyltransferase YhbS
VIEYLDRLEGLAPEALCGFFVGWPAPPTPEQHWEILERSFAFVLARDTQTNEVVGFVTALSDGVFSAFIPLLEVRPSHQKRGIGKVLIQQIEQRLVGVYSIDLVCDPELVPYYAALGYQSLAGQGKRFRKENV